MHPSTYVKLANLATYSYHFRHFMMAGCYCAKRLLRTNVILVMGMSRSGTTFLGRLLALDASRSLYIHEPVKNILRVKYEASQVEGNTEGFWPYVFSDRMRPFKLHALVCTVAYLLWRDRHSRKSLVIKPISMIDTYEKAASILGSRVVYICRHPCGRTESFVRQAEHEENRTIDSLSEFERLGDDWGRTHKKALTIHRAHPGWKWVVFEELCQSPVKIARELYDDLNLKWSHDVATKIEEMTTTESDDLYGTIRDAGKQIAKWQSALSSDQVEAIRRGTQVHNTNLYEGF